MDKSQIPRILIEMADLVEVESDNPFRSRSFRSGARALDSMPGNFSELVRPQKGDRLLFSI